MVALKDKLAPLGADDVAANLIALADHFVRRSVWLVGGDGWAYDIGYGGLDHVLASGRNVNVLVLDTEMYSNTGGQASKATPIGASAKFAAAGKRTPRKDLALMAIAYGNVYVAQISMGANSEQALIAMREAEAYPGPSLILSYSQCISHGTDMRFGMKQAARATASGYWPLFHSIRPCVADMNPSGSTRRAAHSLEEYRYNEVRFKSLTQTRPDDARRMLAQAQLELEEKYRIYEDMAAATAAVSTRTGGRLTMKLASRLSRPRPRASDHRLGVADDGDLRRHAAPGRRQRRRRRDGVAVREQVRSRVTRYAMFTEDTAHSSAEAASYFPQLPDYRYGVSGHLETLRRAAEALDIPVIASLNGITDDGWLDCAVQLEQAGAAALELNLFLLPTDPAVSGSDVEHRYLDIVGHVKRKVGIPVSVKLPPYFSAVANFVARLESIGTDGVVLFNRFYRPDLDVKTLSVQRQQVLVFSPPISTCR